MVTINNINIFESFSGYGSQHKALKNVYGDIVKSKGIMEIDADAIIAYASIHYREHNLNKLASELLRNSNNDDIARIRAELKAKNVGFNHSKNKSSIDRMAKEKLAKLYLADKISNNYGDISLCNDTVIQDIDIYTYSFPCFIAGTMVLTSNGYKDIVDITDDDYVMTHLNRFRKVVKPMINVANHLIKVKTMVSDEIFTTEEHPFYVRKKCRKYNSATRRNERIFGKAEWINAGNLTKDYYVGTPVNTNEIIPEWNGIEHVWSDGRSNRVSNKISEVIETYDFWWIIGRYLGDGWIRSQGGIIICCDFPETNDIVEKLDAIKFNYSISNERTTNKIHISFKEIGVFCETMLSGASNKTVPGFILDLPKSLLKGFLDGYMSADGCIVGNKHKASSVSCKLIYGIGQCIAKVYNRPFAIYKENRPATHVIEGRVVNQKSGYQIVYKLEESKQDKAFFEDGYIWSPINNVEKIDYNGFVYNMEVEEDNSYVVQNIIVHNCQDLSVAGHQNGLDGTRSGLLWECEKFIEINKPKILLMENVKNLIGKKFLPDFEKWVSKLETLGYKTVYGVLDAKDFGVPQQRQRVFAISILGDNDFIMPEGEPNPNRMWNILENTSEESLFFSQDIVDKFIEENGEYEELPLTASLRMLGMINIKGNECIRRVYDKNGLCPTLTTMAGGHRQPKVLLVDDDRNYSIRKLSPLECWRLMGMTLEDFIQAESHCSNSQLYQMAGNSIVVNVLEAIFKKLKKYLTN